MSTSSLTSQRQLSSSSRKSDQRLSPNSNREISLDTLVSHLLASKLSLASIKSVWRAKEIVIAARGALEECAVLTAKLRFLQKGMTNQIMILQKLRAEMEAIYQEGQRDFKTVIRNLDTANERLEVTMNTLRSTIVETAFRPEEEEPRCLLDFVDEKGVETMRDSVKEHIREAKTAQSEFDSAILSFDDDLHAAKVAMQALTVPPTILEYSSPIPEYLQCLESHAEEMAGLLESLVQHFDLCVTAIRNTEGGTAAVRKATSSQPPGTDSVSVSGVLSAENSRTDEGPISDEEMQEIHDVLEKDAAQVDDVVLEIRAHLADMETKSQMIQECVIPLNSCYKEITVAYQMFEIVESRLRGYILSSHDFSLRWDETKGNILSLLDELESIRLFYENYYSSYDSLILEVQRRRQCQDKLQAILRQTTDQLDHLYDTDMREREEFRSDVGEFLPVDLWPGVGDVAPRWELIHVNGNTESPLPLLCVDVIEKAFKRMKRRKMTE